MLIILAISSFLWGRREKSVAGLIFDCDTEQPIGNAHIWSNQIGWGISDGQLVWDKVFRKDTLSALDGGFFLKYRVGNSADLRVVADGYLTSQGWVKSGFARIGLKKGQSKNVSDIIRACRPIAECDRTTVVDGVTVTKNICPDF